VDITPYYYTTPSTLLQCCNKIAQPQQIPRAGRPFGAVCVEMRGFPAIGHIGIEIAY
jgi:hypothetical protein